MAAPRARSSSRRASPRAAVRVLRRFVVHLPHEGDEVVQVGGAAAGADVCFVERWGLKDRAGRSPKLRRRFGLVFGEAACREVHDRAQVVGREHARSALVVQQARRDAKRSGPFIEASGAADGTHELDGILVAERARKVAGFEEQGATLVRVVGDEGGGENGEVEDDDARHAALACEGEPNCRVLPRHHGVYPRADLRGCRVEEGGDDREVLGFGAMGTLEAVRDHLVECENPGVSPNSRRHDFEVRARDGAEALFGGEGLVAQPRRELCVSPVRGLAR